MRMAERHCGGCGGPSGCPLQRYDSSVSPGAISRVLVLPSGPQAQYSSPARHSVPGWYSSVSTTVVATMNNQELLLILLAHIGMPKKKVSGQNEYFNKHLGIPALQNVCMCLPLF